MEDENYNESSESVREAHFYDSNVKIEEDWEQHPSQPESSQSNSNRGNKKGRKARGKNNMTGPKLDIKMKLERSRQSARECRARKKLRYQYLEDLVVKRENANLALKAEIEEVSVICFLF